MMKTSLLKICLASTILLLGARVDTVRQIGQEAFEGCTSLRNVFIPDSVVNIQSHAFPHLDNIKLSTPRRGARNKLYLPKQDIEWYREHLVFIDEKEGE